MRTHYLLSGVLWIAVALLPAAEATAQVEQIATVDAATGVLDEIVAMPGKSIPQALLADAQGIAILPGMIKGGFIIGVRYGRGVIVARDETGAWRAPLFIEIAGASVGWQLGVQGTDLVLVFRTKTSLQNLMRGKLTIGADASAAAGPVGRQASAATDITFQAEILSYSRSRGLFAGVALDGSSLGIDTASNAAYYGPGQPAALPSSATRLLEHVAKYTRAPAAAPQMAAPQMAAPTPLGPPAAPRDARRQLVEASGRLAALLDRSWQEYLALPAEVYGQGGAPNPEVLKMSLSRFNAVATDPQYRSLAERPEFRATWDLLKQYAAASQGPTPIGPMVLPAPPK